MGAGITDKAGKIVNINGRNVGAQAAIACLNRLKYKFVNEINR